MATKNLDAIRSSARDADYGANMHEIQPFGTWFSMPISRSAPRLRESVSISISHGDTITRVT